MMERAVFDTNVLIHYGYDRPEAVDAVLGCTERFISLTTWMEFLVGISVLERPKYKRFLEENFEIIETGFEIAERVIDIQRSYGLKLPDATIYATAKYLHAPLITFNTKDFDAGAPDIYVPSQAA